MKSILDSTGRVVNVIVAGDDWQPPEGLVIGPDGGNIGDTWDGNHYVRPPEPEAVSAPPRAENPAPHPPDTSALEATIGALRQEVEILKGTLDRLAQP